MKDTLQTFRLSASRGCLAFLQVAVLVAIVASQAGERLLRGAEGFAHYRDWLLGQG